MKVSTPNSHQYAYAFFDDGSATVEPPKFGTFKYDLQTPKPKPKKYNYEILPQNPKPTGSPTANQYTFGVLEDPSQKSR